MMKQNTSNSSYASRKMHYEVREEIIFSKMLYDLKCVLYTLPLYLDKPRYDVVAPALNKLIHDYNEKYLPNHIYSVEAYNILYHCIRNAFAPLLPSHPQFADMMKDDLDCIHTTLEEIFQMRRHEK